MNSLEKRAEEDTEEAGDLVEVIAPLLAGIKPEVIGATLGELAATYIAETSPALRAEARWLLIEVIDGLIPLIVEEMIQEGRAPPEWLGKSAQ